MLEVRYFKIYLIKVKKYLDKPIQNCFTLRSTGILSVVHFSNQQSLRPISDRFGLPVCSSLSQK